MRPIYTLAVLGVIIAHSTCQAVVCSDDQSITVSGLPSGYDGLHYSIDDGFGKSACSGTVSGGGFTATGCTHELNSRYYVHFSSDSDFKWIEEQTLPFRCDSVDEGTIKHNADIVRSTLSHESDGVIAELEMTVSPSGSVTVGSSVTIVITLASESLNFYLMQVTKAVIYRTGGSETRDIISEGCPASPDTSSISITGDGTNGYGSTSVTIVYPAFLFFADRDASVAVTYAIEVSAYFCLEGDSNCLYTYECDDDGDKGRKRRQVTDEKTANVNGNITVFPSEESRQRFMDSMRAELGITDATRITSLDDICVPKTTSVAVFVILIAGIVFCFVAAVWMFVKLRKSRRLQDPDKADFAYSNKSFKK